MPGAAGCGGPGSPLDNWEVSEWMKVGIKLPTELRASLSPLVVLPPFALGVSSCWGRFGRVSGALSQFVPASLLPWLPTSLSLLHPCWIGAKGAGMVAGLESQPGAAFGQAGALGFGVLNSPLMGWDGGSSRVPRWGVGC